MLEAKHLVKEYRPKKGNPVKAVNDISIKFPEKGMVFILGKSGSGKSTLLNLLGGLDTYDSGEIIIKGKSSKDFKQSEFDSYRNTYLGFIFQEYNILNDFNVAQNIALALQLQGIKATNEKINEILKEVDLEGYGGRKTSELSGGQKQRVAIARALVKNPEIIMADEPTGALDSKTGLQVFDTLKKLSKEKLVITITHDRDFAELYGDRVIELKDGKIISDIEKYSAEAEKISDGVHITDNKIITVDKGYVLTESDLAVINKYLQEHEAIISVDEKVNCDLKRFSRIGENGKKESLKETDESKIEYKEEKFKLIKSRLPFKNKLKIGASGLKNKPVRLVFTILLSMVAFTMFGLTDTFASYNKITATEKTVFENNINAAVFTVNKNRENDDYGEKFMQTYSTKFSEDDIKELEEKTGKLFLSVEENDQFRMSYYLKDRSPSAYYSAFDISGILETEKSYFDELGFTFKGKFPEKYDETVITDVLFSLVKKYGYSYGDIDLSAADIRTEEDFLSKKPYFEVNTKKYYIMGIVDTKFDGSRFESLKNAENGFDIMNYILLSELQGNVEFGYHGLLYVKKGFMENNDLKKDRRINVSFFNEKYNAYYYRVNSEKNMNDDYEKVYFGGDKLGENQVMVSVEKILYLINDIKQNRGQDTSLGEEIIQNLFEYNAGTSEKTDEKMKAYIRDTVKPYIEENKEKVTEMTFYCDLNYEINYEYYNATIGGYFIKKDMESEYEVVLSEEKMKRVEEAEKDKYVFAIKKGVITKDDWKELIRFNYGKQNEEKSFSLRNGVITTLESVNDFIESTSKIFLYIGIGFAVFAALMLTNFISTSISYKRREIGILRAVGARGSDVYGIFAVESVIIALINFVLSSIATGVVTSVISASLKKEYNLSISVLNFGIRQIALILAVAVVVALVASFIPTFNISRKRPVDAIKK
ncbi:MAG: ABC transporter ATP-binding protein/permease [Clostridia bacterium]|nr:ABC transporter ATP-binding protein/permease [Clostridia bacterium]